MAMRSASLIPSAAAKTLICVDDLRNFDMAGRIYNLFIPQSVDFKSVYEFISVMESFFDSISFPQASCESRAFKSKQKSCCGTQKIVEVCQYMTEEIFDTARGKKATFMVQVQFRQNATWQGTITWTEEKKTQRFRSALEMVKLMNEAMRESDEADMQWE